MSSSQTTARIKSLLLRAWRERWSDVQCSIALNKVLPSRVSGDSVGLAEMMLQQALIGSSPNILVLSYLKHALASQVVSYTATLQSIIKLCDVSRPYCLKSCQELIETFVTNLGSLAVNEDPLQLISTIQHLMYWFLDNIYSITLKAGEGRLSAEYSTVLEKACDVLVLLLSSKANQGLLYLAANDSTGRGSKIDMLQNSLIVSMNILPASVQNKLSQVFKDACSISNHSYPEGAICDPSDHPLNYTVNTLITLEAMLNPCNDVRTFAQQLLVIKKMQGINYPTLYCEILRASYMGVIDAAQGLDELRWAAFAFLKVPLLLSKLVVSDQSAGSDGGLTELQRGIEKFLDYVPLLSLADSKYNCDCLNYLLTGMQNKHNLITETQLQQYLSIRNASGERPRPQEHTTQQTPTLVLRAEPTVTSILKTLEADYSKNQEALLKVLCHMLTGKSFELILAAAAATDKLQSFALKLVKFNEFSQHCGSEKGAQIRACLFDVTFLMLCHIIQLYGTEVITTHKDSQNSFFAQLAILCLPEGGRYKSIETFPPSESAKVEALLEQLKPGSEIRTSAARWNEVCHNTPFAIQELLYAWEHGHINNEGVRTILDNLKSKICCLAVVSVAFLCSYANIAGEEARKKPMGMIHQLGISVQPDPENTHFIGERSHLMSQLIKKMVQEMLPANKRTLKDHIIPPTMPSYTFLHDTYTESFNKGYVDSTSLSKFEGLISVTGTQWFCDYLVKEMLSHTREEEFTKSLGIVFALFHIDLEGLTTALLHKTVPSMVQGSVNKLSMLTDPKGRILSKLCIMCLTAINSSKTVEQEEVPSKGLKRPRTEVEIEDSDYDSDDLRPMKHIKLGDAAAALQAEAFSMDFSSSERETQQRGDKTNPINRSVLNLFHLFVLILESDKISQSTGFILSFLEECVQTGEANSRAILRYMPKNLLPLLMKTLPHSFGTDFILAVCDPTTLTGRKLAAKGICYNCKFQATKRI